MMRNYQVSQRRACVLIGVDPKTVRRERPPDHADIREEMREIAGLSRRFGYRRVGVMLERNRQFSRPSQPAAGPTFVTSAVFKCSLGPIAIRRLLPSRSVLSTTPLASGSKQICGCQLLLHDIRLTKGRRSSKGTFPRREPELLRIFSHSR